ncbi:MAG: YigZ family protein [Clostridia bacterium]|nr:YigZ family protein [Clostridia bacterium]
MQKEYLSVSGRLVTEKVIERSRFITTSCHAESEEEAKSFVAEISKKYSDATHNCYAFIADSLGNLPRFSDNGEPSGTAGMPILEVIKNKKLYCTAVVVTRYFGGIKLGAGGLVRAYSGCAAENLQAAEKLLYTPCVRLVYTADYSLSDLASRFFSSQDCDVVGVEYSDVVTFTVAVKKSMFSAFNAAATDYLNGKITLLSQTDFIHGFPVCSDL